MPLHYRFRFMLLFMSFSFIADIFFELFSARLSPPECWLNAALFFGFSVVSS